MKLGEAGPTSRLDMQTWCFICFKSNRMGTKVEERTKWEIREACHQLTVLEWLNRNGSNKCYGIGNILL